jgi:hypothetical protein
MVSAALKAMKRPNDFITITTPATDHHVPFVLRIGKTKERNRFIMISRKRGKVF